VRGEFLERRVTFEAVTFLFFLVNFKSARKKYMVFHFWMWNMVSQTREKNQDKNMIKNGSGGERNISKRK